MSISITPSYTYDDVLIKPKYSEVMSRKQVNLYQKLTKNISLRLPIISSNMDTITEDKMAIEMAKNGGLGILHRYCTIQQQVEMVKRVKRYTNYIIDNPYTASSDGKMIDVKNVMDKFNVKSVLITNEDNQLKGIITKRDIIYLKNAVDNGKITTDWNEWDVSINEIMTPVEKMVYIEKSKLKTDCNDNSTKNLDNLKAWNDPVDNLIQKNDYNETNSETEKLGIQEILMFLSKHKVQKLPIVNNKEDMKVVGLITLKDMLIRNDEEFKYRATLDKNSQLCVGCAVGVNKDYLERTKAVIEAGCDIICIDIAHGHHCLAKNAIQKIKELYPDIEIIAGNVCTSEGVRYLANAGADCIKVGIGPGSICITRKQTGCGFPQLSAVMECSKEAKKLNVTIIADGGHNRTIGNIFKALCAGATASMLGGMLSGTTETPGLVYTRLNKKVKQIRGMAGIISNFKKTEKMGKDTKYLEKMTPEGVEGYVPFKGPVKDILNQIEGGIRSGLSYVGCEYLQDLKKINIEFALITNNGFKESGSHNIKEI